MMFFRVSSLFVAALALLLTAPQAKAAWHEAQSDHFVIYADDSERDIQRFAENLERYHRAMEYITGRSVPPPSPSSRVVIFVVGNQHDLRRVLDIDSRNIGGIYIPRAGASRAYVQDIRNQSGYPHFSTVILLHEYAHHFLISTSRFAMPRWMSEGAAEFFASTIFNSDGGISIGLPAKHRGGELFNADQVSVQELLDPELYEQRRGSRYDAFYGRSWLLYHYLSFSEARDGQLRQYWQEILEGSGSRGAGEKVFGDLDTLEAELDGYLKRRRMSSYTIAPQHLPIGTVTIRRLPEGEAEIMSVRMASQRGVDAEKAAELLEEARKIAADYPGDAGVLSALAEAEYDAGNDAEAIAAADRAMALDPARTNPYVQKGYALFRMAQDAGDPGAAYAAAMAPFSALNQLENDHPLPLVYYYRSYNERGLEAPENARLALERAAQLAPFDQRLWVQVAIMQAGEGKIALAQESLQPLASDPHGSSIATLARSLIDILEEMPEGEPLVLKPSRANNSAMQKGDEAADAVDIGVDDALDIGVDDAAVVDIVVDDVGENDDAGAG
jgi:Flp pilus assembly protein TadD